MSESTKGQAPHRASVDDAILYLGTEKSWRLTDLPAWIRNERMLRSLDEKYILVRSRSYRGYPVDDPVGWRSLRRNGENWNWLLKTEGAYPDSAPDIKLSEDGRDRFDDLQEHGGRGGAAATPATLTDPIPVISIIKAIGRAAGRSDKLAAKMQRHNYPLEKRAVKWYCQRADALAMFPNSKHKEKIKEI